VGNGVGRGVMVGAGVGVSVGLESRPHPDKARLNDVMPLNLRKSRRDIFFDLLFTITHSLDVSHQRLALAAAGGEKAWKRKTAKVTNNV